MQNVFQLSKHVGELTGTKNFTKLIHKRNQQFGYVLALSYSGQQGAGIQALTSLQCWVASFNLPMLVLEPIISKTVLVSIPRDLLHTPFLRFSDLFNIHHFNKISESLENALMGTREEFFTDGPRNAIYIYVKLAHKHALKEPKVVWRAEYKGDRKKSCYQFQAGRIMKLAREKGFCFVRIIEATSSQSQFLKITDKDVRDVIFGDQLPQHVTVVFSKWKTPWFVANNDLENPFKCKKAGRRSSKEQFLPSPRLLSDVEKYESHFLNSSNDSGVALMLRLERMLEYLQQPQHSSGWTADKCLYEALRLTKELQGSGYPTVTLDVGKFGSSSFRGVGSKHLTEKSKQLLTKLYDNTLTFEEWEESFTKATGGVENSGYIAALQRTLASRAKCLILVGGGNFQDLALKDYLRNHSDKEYQCIHLVCVKNDILLSEVISGNKFQTDSTQS